MSFEQIKNDVISGLLLLGKNVKNEKEKEGFTLPPFEESKNIDPNTKTLMGKYNATEREIYDVIDKFDLEPSELTPNERAMRKKYLQILLKMVDNELNDMLSQQPIDPIMLQNKDSSMKVLKKVISLMIKDLTTPSSVDTKIPVKFNNPVSHSSQNMLRFEIDTNYLLLGVVLLVVFIFMINKTKK
jgi:hypothetical protein